MPAGHPFSWLGHGFGDAVENISALSMCFLLVGPFLAIGRYLCRRAGDRCGGEFAVKLRLPFLPSFRDHYAMRLFSSIAVAVLPLSPSPAVTSVDMPLTRNRVIRKITQEISAARIEATMRRFRMPARSGYAPIMRGIHPIRTGVGT